MTDLDPKALEAAEKAYWRYDSLPPDCGALSAAITAYMSACWRPIGEGEENGTLGLIAYDDGHVVPAEFSEHSVGGPDDFRGWMPVWGDDKRDREWRDYPTHFRPLPPPPEELT